MKKVKYYYDPETLSYKRIRNRKRTKVRNALIFITAAALFGILFSFIMINSRLFFTPREVVLAREIKTYETNYQILNKKMELVEDVLADIQERDNNMYRLYFNAPVIPDSIRKSLKNPNRYKDLEKFGNSKLIASTNERLDVLRKQLVVQSKSLDEITKLSKAKEKFLASIPAIQPINNKDLKHMASGYGWRTDPFTKARKFHYGMDFASPQGTPVYAAGDGVVGGADHGAQHPKQPIAAGAGGDRRQRFLSLLTAHLVLNLNGLRGGHINFGIGLGSLAGLAFKHLKGGA